MKYLINEDYSSIESSLLDIPSKFKTTGELLFKHRNIIKTFIVDNKCLNVKSFKIPNVINRFVYKYIRLSKAKRSFIYAQRLLDLGINTPIPVTYIEYFNWFGLKDSFYVSEQLDCDYVFKDIIGKNISDIEDILIAFTKFTHNMHKKGVYFIDHSPGNTLIKITEKGYDFFLVDLNRTRFLKKEVSLDLGIKNFYRLGSTPEMIEVMSKEYARLRGVDADYVLKKMMTLTMDHNVAVINKKAKRLKRKK